MKEGPDRRTFLKQSAVAASALAAGCSPDGASEGAGGAGGEGGHGSRLPEGTLRAVGEAVLPSEFGPADIERIVAGFENWLADYAPVAELVHGYGSQEIRYGPPHPGPRWASQLEALALEAHARHRAAFEALPPAERRELIERALEDERGGSLADRPGALEAGHVVVGLLAYFYGSPEATDLCYQRRIGGASCRTLAASAQQPPRIEERIAALAPRARTDPARPSRLHPGVIERGLEPGS